MQIQLKQPEILSALRDYVAKQGISLVDKTVDISFTSGRKDNGLSADISIEDIGSSVAVIKEPAKIPEAQPLVSEVKKTVIVTVGEPEAPLPAPVAAGKSLFG
jgi:hypothetical protein